jgi:glycogen phosphorylase
MADLPSYIDASRRADDDYQHADLWARKAILNVARVGIFSSDRTIAEYARDIWHIQPAIGTMADLPFSKEHVSTEVTR